MNDKKIESKEKEPKSDDGLAAKVRKTEETVKKVVTVLEKMFGVDIDRDGKVGGFVLALLMSASVCFGASQSTNTVWNVADSTGTNDLIQVSNTGDLVIDGSITADSLTGNVTGAATLSELSLDATSLAVTSGQAIALGAYPVIKVSAAAQASVTTTNTISAVGSAYIGNTYYIVNVGASNGVLVADSAPAYNSGVTLGQYDVSSYYVVDTNVIVQTGTINN